MFSLRAQPQEREHDDLLEPDKGMVSFFLPTIEEGLAFVRCYFEHVRKFRSPSTTSGFSYSHTQASSTYRFVDEEDITALAHRFFARDPVVLADIESTALLLAVMATGCLWMPSWTGQDPQVLTPQACVPPLRPYRNQQLIENRDTVSSSITPHSASLRRFRPFPPGSP